MERDQQGTPGRRTVADLFADLVEIDISERSEFLERSCRRDEALRNRLESLLDEYDQEGGFLEDTHAADHIGELAASAIGGDEAVPERIGQYRVLRVIGSGGMGMVYEAEQEKPRRRVAIKMLLGAAWSPAARTRFRREVETLGRLNHSGIAQIFGSGEDESDARAPYFAMEYVDGHRLTDYANEHDLDVGARIDLIAFLASAVHHAHERGVIHRDLKPANIMVDKAGRPKLLDFGISRFTDGEEEHERLTDPALESPGTPSYMSPEQLAGVDVITTAVDQHALGVITYELLVGRPAYDVKTQGDAMRTIGHVAVPRLARADRRLRGDLDRIVAKAMATDPADRYDSIAAFGADLQRWRTQEPIVARPQSAVYHLRKFAQRNPAIVVFLVVLAIVCLVGVSAVSAAWSRAELAEENSNRRAREIEAITAVASAVDPLTSAGSGNFKFDEVVGTISQELDVRAPDLEPPTQIALRLMVATMYRSAQRTGDALEQYNRIRELANDAGDESFEMVNLAANALRDLGQVENAEPLYRMVVEYARQNVTDPGDLAIVLTNHALALAETGRQDGAMELLEEVLELRQTINPRSRELISTLSHLAYARLQARAFDDARGHAAHAIRVAQSIDGEDGSEQLSPLLYLIWIERESGHLELAVTLTRRHLALTEAHFGPEHAHVGVALVNTASVLERIDDLEGAETALRRALNIFRSHEPTLLEDLRQGLIRLSKILRSTDRDSEAAQVESELAEVESLIGVPDDGADS